MKTVAGILLLAITACSSPPEPEPPPPPPVAPTAAAPPGAPWDREVIAADVKLLGLQAVGSGAGPEIAFGAVRDGEDRTLLWTGDASGEATRIVAARGAPAGAARDGRGRLHMIFGAPLAYAVTTDSASGAAPLPSAAIRLEGEDGAHAGLAVDRDGIAHVCFVAKHGAKRELVLGIRADDAWQVEPLQLPAGGCALAFGADGSLHVVSAGRGVHHGLRRGQTWSIASVDPADGAHGPSVAVTRGGEAVITWVNGGRAHYAHHAGGAWARDDLGEDVVGWRAPFVLDASDRPHVAFHARRRVTDEAGKPLVDASTVVVAHHDGERWVEQEVADSRSQGIGIGLWDGQPHVFYFDPIRDWLVHAKRRDPSDCEPGRLRLDGACCWPGQRAAGGACSGEPACPEGFFQSQAKDCQALPREVAFGAASCTQVHINRPIDLGAEKACRLAASHERGPRYFQQRCDAGHAADCYVLGALSDQLVTRQSAYVLMPLCKTICRHARRSWSGNPIVEGRENAGEALVAYRRACELGHRDACVRVADLSDRDAERRELLVSLCTKDRRQPMCSRAVNEAPEIATIDAVATTLASLCKEGNAAACGDLGVLTENGEGLKADLDAALSLYEKGCGGGHLPSCRSVAYAAANHPDRRAKLAAAAKSAFTALKAECDGGGDPRACHGLAVQYDLGFGVARDDQRAEALYAEVCKDRTSLLCQRP